MPDHWAEAFSTFATWFAVVFAAVMFIRVLIGV
jgi:hypothetical protein